MSERFIKVGGNGIGETLINTIDITTLTITLDSESSLFILEIKVRTGDRHWSIDPGAHLEIVRLAEGIIQHSRQRFVLLCDYNIYININFISTVSHVQNYVGHPGDRIIITTLDHREWHHCPADKIATRRFLDEVGRGNVLVMRVKPESKLQ
jgi:hypothetical protein